MFRPWENNEVVMVNEELVGGVNEGLIGEVNEELLGGVNEQFMDGRVNEEAVRLKRKTHLSACCKEMVKRVYTGLCKYKSSSEAIKLTIELTQVSSTTVWRIINKQENGESFERKIRKDKGVFKKLNENDAKIIGRKIYEMYDRNEIPTLNSLKKEVNIDEDYPRISCSKETLRKFLLEMQFTFKTIDKRQGIIETERLRKLRFNYLCTIDRFRKEHRPIFYLDETWFDTHDTVKKGWVDDSPKCRLNVPSSRGKRITILHCGSESGWVSDGLLLSAKNIRDCSLDYHQDMTAELFEKWFEYTLLPKLPVNSVIVLDNASYHSRLSEKIPTSMNNKNDIKIFLERNNLFFEDSYSKKDLLEVLHTQTYEKSYIIDKMAEKNGHTVLRLPPYHCIFNPIELIWSQLKQNVRRKNTSPKLSTSVLELIKLEVSLIGIENWKNAIKHVVTIENNFRKLWEDMDSFVINVNNEETSSDSNLSDSGDI